MSAQMILEQLFKSGKTLLDSKGGLGGAIGSLTKGGGLSSLGGLGDLANIGQSKNESRREEKSGKGASEGWGKFGMGTATGGALGLLLGSKRGRNMGGKALKYGSVAALGLMAYKAYSIWQEKQAASGAPGQQGNAAGFPAAPAGQQPQSWGHQGGAGMAGATGAREPAGNRAATVIEPVSVTQVQPAPTAAWGHDRTVDRLPPAEVEVHSVAMLGAMIAAAKADGHLDERERELVEAELNRLEADPAMRRWFEEQLRRPLDPAEVAKAAATPEMASEMYLVSLLICDETSFMERAYLDELARQLRLPEGLKAELEVQSRTV
jgi:uncharacterized membrane protein YebE (DUF533 family)